jgi:DNA-binding protein
MEGNSSKQNNEIRVSLKTNLRKVTNYIISLFEDKQFDSVYICGLNKAINKIVLIAEIVKLHVGNLHQTNKIDSLLLKERTPIISGAISRVKRIPKLDIVLSLKEPEVKEEGYQQPYEINKQKLISNSFKYLSDDETFYSDYVNHNTTKKFVTRRGRPTFRGPSFRFRIRSNK